MRTTRGAAPRSQKRKPDEPTRRAFLTALSALIAAGGERAGMRFLEFFVADIRNPHTRRAYARAADEFLAGCARAPACRRSASVQPEHVAISKASSCQTR